MIRRGRGTGGGERTLGAHVLTAVRIALLVGPFVLAFADGGYFAGPRLVALAVAFAALGVAAAATRERPDGIAVAALGGLFALAAWTAISSAWAPEHAPAVDSRERALLYAVTVAAAFLSLRPRRIALRCEPADR